VSQGEAHILAHLATSGPTTIAGLHRGLAHKRSTLTSILDRLAERGFITRQVGTTDRRTFVIKLTARGRQVAARVHRHLDGLERSVAGRFSPDELRAFTRVLAAVEEEAHRKSRVGSRELRDEPPATSHESRVTPLTPSKPTRR
jgi:DNA-binding MarR family transcriptional regulator